MENAGQRTMPQHTEGGGRSHVALEKIVQLRQIFVLFSFAVTIADKCLKATFGRLGKKKNVRSDTTIPEGTPNTWGPSFAVRRDTPREIFLSPNAP